VSDMTLKYPLWQNQYLQAMAETRPELLKRKLVSQSRSSASDSGNWQGPRTTTRNK